VSQFQQLTVDTSAIACVHCSGRRRGVDKQKLIIILVGLPGRGKTFLCNKLMCYLNWLGALTCT
jgi:signal recognition particle GTPase